MSAAGADAPPAVLLMGPTASGKSGLALELAARLDAEIVSVDSAQVYRGMDIGTAKPTPAERAAVPHHLIDILDPAQPYSAARFRTDALDAIAAIRARGRLPLLVGGTMLYFHALLRGLSSLPGADPAVRARLAQEAELEGWPALHARLSRLDPDSGARLHPNDGQRILRALEIIELSGGPVARAQARREGAPLSGPVVPLALWLEDRGQLHRRIERRFRDMMQAGFLDEVRVLRGRGDLSPELPSMRAVGYRQLWRHLEQGGELEAAVASGIAATRQLAKRQCTWLRSMPEVERIRADEPGPVEQALRALRRARPQGA